MFPLDPHEPNLIRWMRNPAVRRTLISGLLWLTIAFILIRFSAILLPFGLAVLVAFIIEPIVARATARRIFGRPVRRLYVILAIYLVGLGLLYVGVRHAVPEMGRELKRLGAESRTILTQVDGALGATLDAIARWAEENHFRVNRAELEASIRSYIRGTWTTINTNAGGLLAIGRSVVGGAFHAVFGTFLVLMLTAFMSADRARIQRFVLSIVPPEQRRNYDQIISGITRGLGGVVRGQILICLTNGVLTFIGLKILDVKFPVLLAVVATVFSLVPIFGSILSTIPIVAVALTDGLPRGMFALLWIIGIHIVEANLLNPKIMGDAARIHPILVVFSLIAGERLGGLVGALFAVPIASVFVEIFKFLRQQALQAGRKESTDVPISEADESPAPRET